MHCKFNRYSSLKSLDLSSFNTTNANRMKHMFINCSPLKKENVQVNDKKF